MKTLRISPCKDANIALVDQLRVGVSRRRLLTLGVSLAAGEALGACTSRAVTVHDATDGGATDAANLIPETDAAAVPWATGGTAAMIDKATYPKPFAAVTSVACAMTCGLTEGPCYSSQSVETQDISYGYAGLPMRMYFQVVDEACKPVEGALLDVWHVSPVGKYSGNDSANEDVAFCTGNDTDFTSHLYFRGKQTTDANGVAFFDTCFPGWYGGRTVHVHLTISVAGKAYVTTQLGFADALDDEIVKSQPAYDTRGARDTTNTTDTVFSPADYQDYLFQTRKMTDGAMLAWKTIVLRSALTESLCSPSGGSGQTPGGPMRRPDGGAPTPPGR